METVFPGTNLQPEPSADMVHDPLLVGSFSMLFPGPATPLTPRGANKLFKTPILSSSVPSAGLSETSINLTSVPVVLVQCGIVVVIAVAGVIVVGVPMYNSRSGWSICVAEVFLVKPVTTGSVTVSK